MAMIGMNRLVRYDVRCPICQKDSIIISVVNPHSFKLACCERVILLKELRMLKTECFAPRFKDGTLHEGYIGAVKQSELEEKDLIQFSDALGKFLAWFREGSKGDVGRYTVKEDENGNPKA